MTRQDGVLPAILGIAGPVLSEAERALFASLPPAGVILFARNIVDPAQLAGLNAALRAVLPAGAKLMVDQEGGRVARLRAPFWPELPAAGTLKTAAAAYAHGRALGEMARAAGFDVVAAPVLDVRHDGADEVIGDRAISGDPRIVAQFGGRMAAGMLEAGVTPVMKHVPGHGRARVDSHAALPVVAARDLADDFHPFIENAGLPWAMTAHILYEAYDATRPATISPIVIERVIRGVIGFRGTLVSDDLAMGALAGTPAERAAACLAAGCDLALYCAGDAAGNAAILRMLADG